MLSVSGFGLTFESFNPDNLFIANLPAKGVLRRLAKNPATKAPQIESATVPERLCLPAGAT